MDPETHIPERLAADLKRVYRASVPVPGEGEARVLAAAGSSRPAQQGMPLRWRLIKWVGIAAAVFLALVVPTQLSRNSQTPRVVAVGPGDVNGDGTIDILDAFALARAMRDGDSTVTKADIDAAAARAVRLGAGGGGA